jgi:hypothetical protein
MRSILATGLVCVLVVMGAVTMKAQGGQAPQPLLNLQVLPKTMTRQEVTALMRSFTAALGVQCNHCHVGGPTSADRSKDELPAKAMARKMLQLSMTINTDLLKDVGTPAPEGTRKVTCYTCHRGALKPLTAPAAGGGF